MSDLLARIEELEGKLRALESELAELRREASATEPDPTPAPVVPPPPPPKPRPTAAPVYTTAGAGTPPPAPKPPQELPASRPPRAPRFEVPEVDLSALVGARGLAWVGGLVTLLGIVFFFVLAVNRGWVSEELRVALGAIASAALYASAWWIQRRFGSMQASLAAAGAGIAGAYVTLFAATGMYDLVPESAALVASALVAAVGVLTALRWNSELTAVLGLGGAMLGPVILEAGEPSSIGALYVGAGLAAALVVGNRRGWYLTALTAGGLALLEAAGIVDAHDPGASTSAALLAGLYVLLYLAGTLVIRGSDDLARLLRGGFLVISIAGALWIVSTFGDPSPPRGSVAVAVGLWLAYLVAGIGLQLHARRSALLRTATSMILAGVGLAFFGAIAVWDPSEENIGRALLVVSALTAAPILLGLRIRGQRNLWTVLWAASLAVLAVAAGYLLGGEGLVLAWSAQAALAACVAVFAREERLQVAGAGYLGLAIAHVLAYDARPDELFERAPSFALAPIVFVALGGAVAAVALHRGRLRPSWGSFAAAVAGGAAAVYAGSFFLLDQLVFQRAEAAITAWWAAAGLAVLLAALWRRSPRMHIASLALFIAAAVKLAAFDLLELDARYSGWALLAFGLATLAAGYAEGRFGWIVLPESLGRDQLNGAAVVFLPLSAIAAGFGLARILDGDVAGLDAQGLSLVALGAVYGVLAWTTFGREHERDLTTLLWALGALVAAIGFGEHLLEAPWLVLAWSALGAGLAWLGARTKEERFWFGAVALVGFAFAYTLLYETPPDTLVRVSSTPGDGLLSLVFSGLGVVGLALCLPPGQIRRIAVWVAGAIGLFAGSLAILALFEWPAADTQSAIDAAFQRGHTAVSAAWVLVGLTLLALGLQRGRRSLRLGGLVLFGLALVKIFAYDLANLSSLARAFSFLVVGAVLLVAALIYQRLAEASSRGTARPG